MQFQPNTRPFWKHLLSGFLIKMAKFEVLGTSIFARPGCPCSKISITVPARSVPRTPDEGQESFFESLEARMVYFNQIKMINVVFKFK